MLITVLKSKIHNARVTVFNVDYEGSLSLVVEIINQSSLSPYEKVLVANVTNGERFETYIILAPANSREEGINGAAARSVVVGDRIIVKAFAMKEPDEEVDTTVLIMDEKNNIKEVKKLKA